MPLFLRRQARSIRNPRSYRRLRDERGVESARHAPRPHASDQDLKSRIQRALGARSAAVAALNHTYTCQTFRRRSKLPGDGTCRGPAAQGPWPLDRTLHYGQKTGWVTTVTQRKFGAAVAYWRRGATLPGVRKENSRIRFTGRIGFLDTGRIVRTSNGGVNVVRRWGLSWGE